MRQINLIDLEVPRRALVTHVTLAGLAAVGLMTLFPPVGGRGQATIVLPVLTILLALGTVVAWRHTVDQAREEAGNATLADPRTGVASVVAGKQALKREFSAAQRGRILTVVLIRIEGLTTYRRQHGKVVTEQLIRRIGRVLGRNRRGMHVVAEHTEPGTFISILSGIDRKGAAIYATRMRRGLLRLKGLPGPSGIGVGVAAFDMSMESPDDMVRRAAIGLRRGATTGGRVVVVGENNGAEAAGASRFF